MAIASSCSSSIYLHICNFKQEIGKHDSFSLHIDSWHLNFVNKIVNGKKTMRLCVYWWYWTKWSVTALFMIWCQYIYILTSTIDKLHYAYAHEYHNLAICFERNEYFQKIKLSCTQYTMSIGFFISEAICVRVCVLR